MADPRSMTLDGLLSRIDRVVRHHEQLSEWAAPVLDGPIFPQQVERHRMAVTLHDELVGFDHAPEEIILADPAPVVPAAVADFIANARPGDRLDLGVVCRRPPQPVAVPEPTGWMTMLKSWARWPNA